MRRKRNPTLSQLDTDVAEPRVPVRMDPLCCTICRRVLRNPVTIPCQHNFCMRCIQDRWDHDERTKSPCGCPECGCAFSSRPRLNKKKIRKDLPRASKRPVPGGEKRKLQRSGGSTEVPKRPHLSTETGSPLCWTHSSSLDVYCCTDEQILCTACASAEHSGHTVVLVKDERKRKQVELKKILEKSKQDLQEQKATCRKLKRTLNQVEVEARNTEDYCECILADIIDFLQRHFLSTKKRIGTQEEVVASRVRASLRTLQGKMEELRKRTAELECLVQTDNHVHFLQEWLSLQRLCEKDFRHPLRGVSDDPLRPFEFTRSAFDELRKELKIFCDQRFTSVFQSADVGDQQQSEEEEDEDEYEDEEEQEEDNQWGLEARVSLPHGRPGVYNSPTVEPTTRTGFLQYACNLSLDPTTAHKELVISAGDKEVRLNRSKRGSLAGWPRHPQRFVHRRQVLCREGLQAERCYYEIEVEGEKSEIALAYRGINRKSRTSLSAFGGNTNSWSLDRSTSYSVSHNGNSIQLTAPPSHHRIGIYLKFKEGTLSFYEVSDSMKLLYTAEAEFREPLYPGFWLGEKCRIRICELT